MAIINVSVILLSFRSSFMWRSWSSRVNFMHLGPVLAQCAIRSACGQTRADGWLDALKNACERFHETIPCALACQTCWKDHTFFKAFGQPSTIVCLPAEVRLSKHSLLHVLSDSYLFNAYLFYTLFLACFLMRLREEALLYDVEARCSCGSCNMSVAKSSAT